ncbi:hypothetical protein DdX_00041 [Ditylenchus destructor]|uniref:Uncharacterized protein n=1 Tax=Ditylenchus destructor TaxID=166010 RepID=A0AAD4NJB3_9BILA|nr:hypothetical protein DdX_00041 [Ditylenchus destructor]
MSENNDYKPRGTFARFLCTIAPHAFKETLNRAKEDENRYHETPFYEDAKTFEKQVLDLNNSSGEPKVQENEQHVE